MEVNLEKIYIQIFEIKIGHPRLSMGESILPLHACAYRTVIYGVVIVDRNLERANENDGCKMTARDS